MKKQRILVVDDERGMVETISLLLEIDGYTVIQANDAREALRRAYSDHPDLILLDILLPDKNGIDVLKQLKSQADVPIILITGYPQPPIEVTGLDDGADDFIAKPFANDVLLARVRRALRDYPRPSGNGKKMQIATANLVIDVGAHRLFQDDRPVPLTPTEWRLFYCLVQKQGQVVLYDELLHAGWQDSELRDTRSIKVQIAHIRKKLKEREGAHKYIWTERELGYCFDPERSANL